MRLACGTRWAPRDGLKRVGARAIEQVPGVRNASSTAHLAHLGHCGREFRICGAYSVAIFLPSGPSSSRYRTRMCFNLLLGTAVSLAPLVFSSQVVLEEDAPVTTRTSPSQRATLLDVRRIHIPSADQGAKRVLLTLSPARRTSSNCRWRTGLRRI
ncbi:hypothetical protein DFH07DRAFT_827047 [Mycena maculata]|uniref:Uncharacterized protein n=1 Tax=Mycena maculata TaxID=230809 RepID=A0AAD7IUT7_9AGAR|nr:hypothetical protein DFH07DRAFT_827047 [Mycena maculata]